MRLYFLFFVQLVLLYSIDKPALIHAMKYREQNISGWVMSEKLDGVRAVWNGYVLLTRQGNPLHPNNKFIQNFPPFPLDGELWTKHGDFEQIASIVSDTNTSGRWLTLTYNLFEAPFSEGNFSQRLGRIKRWFDARPNPYIRIIPQIPIKSKKTLDHFLEQIEKTGGEGVMVKNPATPYLS